MDEAESGAPGRKKVPQSLLHKAKQFFILLQVICLLCICAVVT